MMPATVVDARRIVLRRLAEQPMRADQPGAVRTNDEIVDHGAGCAVGMRRVGGPQRLDRINAR
jgi:hypothetical protein